MSETFRPYDPKQMLLMPEILQDWLPADPLDLSDIMERYRGALTGGERSSVLPSADDGQGAPLHLLRWGTLLPSDGKASL